MTLMRHLHECHAKVCDKIRKTVVRNASDMLALVAHEKSFITLGLGCVLEQHIDFHGSKPNQHLLQVSQVDLASIVLVLIFETC